jgi:hypothetical protein
MLKMNTAYVIVYCNSLMDMDMDIIETSDEFDSADTIIPNITCADLSFIINMLIDRGLNSGLFLNNYFNLYNHEWCSHCVNTKMRTFCRNEYDFGAFINSNAHMPLFPISGTKIRQLLTQYNMRGYIDIDYLLEHDVEIDREIALILMHGGQYHQTMHDLIFREDVVDMMVNGISGQLYKNISDLMIIHCDTELLSMIIAKWREYTSSELHMVTVKKYSYLYYNINLFPRAVIEMYWADIDELFPTLLVSSNISQYFKNDNPRGQKMSPNICPIDLADRIMSYSDEESYVSEAFSGFNLITKYSDSGKYMYDLMNLIIHKHPKYIRCLLISYDTLDKITITMPLKHKTLLLDNIHVEYISKDDFRRLILNNIIHDPLLLRYLPKHMRHTISIEDIDRYLHVIITTINIKHDQMAHMVCDNTYFTLFDIIQINRGITFADITDDIILIYINDVLDNPYIGQLVQPNNEISFAHIVKLLRRNINIINMLWTESIIKILPILYTEFWEGLREIDAVMRKYDVPRDVADMIRLYYVSPTANDADIAKMLIARGIM